MLNLEKTPVMSAEELDILIEEALAQGMLGKMRFDKFLPILMLVAAVAACAAVVLVYRQTEVMKAVLEFLASTNTKLDALLLKEKWLEKKKKQEF